MYIVQTVHTGLMLDVQTVQTVHCAGHTGLMLDVHCADCTYRTNVRCTLCRLYIQE